MSGREAAGGPTNVLALIPARGGSRRLPGKNLMPFRGLPLLAWTVLAAKAAGVARVVLSTDDPAIAEAGTAHGAEVPFLRPASLSTDEATSVDVVLHALDALGDPDILVLLQPTSPLRAPEDIEACLALVRAGAPAALTASPLPKPWAFQRRVDAEGGLAVPGPPPGGPPTHVLNGAVYAIRPAVLRRERRFDPPGVRVHTMPVERSADIDTALDFALAEAAAGALDGARPAP